MLAERGRLSMDAAFDHLRRDARCHNLRLSELAADVVAPGVVTAAVLAAPLTQPRRRP